MYSKKTVPPKFIRAVHQSALSWLIALPLSGKHQLADPYGEPAFPGCLYIGNFDEWRGAVEAALNLSLGKGKRKFVGGIILATPEFVFRLGLHKIKDGLILFHAIYMLHIAGKRRGMQQG